MRRTVFILSLTFVVLWGFSNQSLAQEKDSTEEAIRETFKVLGSAGAVEGLKAMELLGRIKGQYQLEDLEGLQVLDSLGSLDLPSLDVADEYLDILEQCRGMLEDYEDYLDQLDDSDRVEHEISVDQIRRRLDDNTYIDDPDKLIDDLTETITAIKEIERAHKAEKNSNNPRCCRVIRNLRREMVILVDLVEDYKDQQVEVILNRKEIKKYMEEALKVYVEALRRTEEALRQQREEAQIPLVIIPPSPPEPPTPPEAPVFPEWSQYGKSSRGEIGLVRRFEDSIKVISALPVEIHNSAGGVQVTGWNEDFILAVLGVEVSSDSRAKEKRFADETDLEVKSVSGVYKVEAKFPELSDPETKIIRCLLRVNVPEDLHIQSDNSFGDVLITDIRNGATVTSRHSSVTLDNIRGNIEVQNTMGKISLSDIRGDINARTSYSPISLVGCDGQMIIDNSYAVVTLSDTRGPVKVTNSGQVVVQDHRGKVEIDNTYGAVRVQDVNGDVIAFNAYQPIEVNSVDGSVQLENAYSQINILDVTGGINASNSHGAIQVDEPEGPLVLDNKNGSVTIVLGNRFNGASTVNNTHGTVSLLFSDEPDMKILASVTDGRISSPLTYNVDKRGNTTDAEWVIGKGGSTLKIIGQASNLVVKDQ